MEIIDDTLADQHIILTRESRIDLRSAGTWAMMISVLGIIGVVILIISGISLLFFVSNTGISGPDLNRPDVFNYMGLFFFLMAAIFLIPCIYLFRFSLHAMKADSSAIFQIETTFKFLKKAFMSYVIIVGVSIILYFIWFGMAMTSFQ